MANERGAWAGLGNALNDIGQIGLSEEISKRKEARLQKLQLEIEARSEERQIASEGRAEGRAIAAEGRAGDRAEQERAAMSAAEKERDERLHNSRLAEIDAQAAAQRRNKEHEHDLGSKGGPKFKLASTEGSTLEPGQTYIYNETDPQQIYVVDPKTQRLLPVGTESSVATPSIPPEVEAAARKAARQEVSSKTGYFSSDPSDLKEFGGDRGTAEDILTRQRLPSMLRAYGYNPSDYGFSDEKKPGLVTQAAAGAPKPITKDTTSPVVLPAAGNGGTDKRSVQSPAGSSLPPAAAARLKEGQVTRFANGQAWTLKGGVPTRVN